MKWFIGVLFLLTAALVLRSGFLAYSMYVVLSLLVVSRFLTISWMDRVTAVRRGHSQEVEVGTVVPVWIRVVNEGRFPVPWLLMEDLIPAKWLTGSKLRLAVKRKRIKIVPLWDETELEYEIHFKMRGFYQIGPLVLETGDLFGLHRRHRLATPAEYVLVYPRIIALEGYDIASRRPVGEIQISHRFFEDPTRVAGIRAYEPGDPLNRIHWKVSGHSGILHSKIFEPSTIAGATLVLDFHQDSWDPDREPERSELAVTAVGSLAHALTVMNEQVGLVSNGRDAADRLHKRGFQYDFRTRREALQTGLEENPNERLQPLIVETGTGADKFQRIRTMLARVEMNDGMPLPMLLLEGGRLLPRNATVIVFLGAVPPEIALALGNLRRRGYQVAAILVCMEEEELIKAQTRLAVERIRTQHFKDEQELTRMCQMATIR